MTAEKLEQFLIDFRRRLHQYPELSNQEFKTSQAIKQVLDEHGVEVIPTTLKTGVFAKITGGYSGRTIAIRADIDALPIEEQADVTYRSQHSGVMHACGHDFHTAAIVGATILLQQQRATLRGTVIVLFQAAEETGIGAVSVLESGVLDGVEAIFGFHNDPMLPIGTCGTKVGALTAAVDRFEINVHGIGAHAAKPHEGIDPIIVIGQLIQAFQPIVSRNLAPDSHAVVSITQVYSGQTWNVIPNHAYLEGTVRSFGTENRLQIEKRIRTIVEGVAHAHQVEIELIWHTIAVSVNNDKGWTEKAMAVAQQVGYQTVTVKESAIGEDFAYYQEKIPGAYMMIGSGGPYELHHPKFKVDDRALFPIAQYFAELVCSILK